MKKILLSVTSLAALSASAFAADLPASNDHASFAQLPMWTGFYAGFNAGYGFGVSSNAQQTGWANPDQEFTGTADTMAYALANSSPGGGIMQGGFLGGGQIGYNHQFDQRLLLGFEADMQGAGMRGSGNAIGVGPSDQSDTGYFGNGNFIYVNTSVIQAGIDWMGTARARVGYLITPSVLLYGTGGLAYGGAYLNTFPTQVVATSDGGAGMAGPLTTQNARNQIQVGWTAGGGAEWMLANGWSIKGEAVYYDLGSMAVANTQYDSPSNLLVGGSTTRAYYQGVIARGGLNYHFSPFTTNENNSTSTAGIVSFKSASTAAIAPVWTGFYVGLNSGYGFGTSSNAQNYGWANPGYFADNVDTAAYAVASSGPASGIQQGGFFGGGQAGYNYQFSQSFMIGFEADMQGAGIRGTGRSAGIGLSDPNLGYSYVNTSVIQAGVDWMGTARARFGYLIAPSLQLFSTGGLAYGGGYLKTFPTIASSNLSQGYAAAWGPLTTQNDTNQLLVGWTVGGGAEWFFAKSWSIKSEALYYNLGSIAVSNSQYDGSLVQEQLVGGSTTRAYYQGVIARAGINYHFNLEPSSLALKF